ncbi:unnamed protein product [Leptosia nina]|uniref:Uncharacterized protein n=1 Tax=Leptosia nina TaxID=320188 RepID=A0AAV1K0M1_9NEOP
MYTLADLDAIFTDAQSLQSTNIQQDIIEDNTIDTQDINLALIEPDEVLKDVILPPSFDRNNIFDVQGMVDDNFLEVDEMPRDVLGTNEEFDVSKFFNLPDEKQREPNEDSD